MSQPLDRRYKMPALGEVDEDRGEFWVENPFDIPSAGENLSAYETNRLYTNLDGQAFIDVSFTSGVDLDSDSRSVICADFNNDGAEDMLVCSVGGGPLRLFINQFPNRGHRLKVDLIGVDSNVAAIGSRVTVHCGDRRIVRDCFPTNGFMGQSPPELLIGLGDSDHVDRLEVRWPTGKVQFFEGLSADSRITITENEPELSLEAF